MVVAHVILVLALSPNSKSIFFLFWGDFYGQRLKFLGQGLGLGLGPGLDNCYFKCLVLETFDNISSNFLKTTK